MEARAYVGLDEPRPAPEREEPPGEVREPMQLALPGWNPGQYGVAPDGEAVPTDVPRDVPAQVEGPQGQQQRRSTLACGALGERGRVERGKDLAGPHVPLRLAGQPVRQWFRGVLRQRSGSPMSSPGAGWSLLAPVVSKTSISVHAAPSF